MSDSWEDLPWSTVAISWGIVAVAVWIDFCFVYALLTMR